jgi:hypothetical protein
LYFPVDAVWCAQERGAILCADGAAMTASHEMKGKHNYLGLWGWGHASSCTDRVGNVPVSLSSSCWTYAGYSLPLTKVVLRAMVENGTVQVFHEDSVRFRSPHVHSFLRVFNAMKSCARGHKG